MRLITNPSPIPITGETNNKFFSEKVEKKLLFIGSNTTPPNR